MKLIKKYKYLLTLTLIIIIITICIIRKKNLKNSNTEYLTDNVIEEFSEKEEVKENNEQEKIKVDIKGQVVNPGVYELNSGSRVIDVVKEAGGLTDIANTSLINLSKVLEDQMVIIIYSEEEVLNSNVKEVETVFKIVEKECVCPAIKNDGCVNTELENDSDKEVININTASLEELTTLPSVGSSKAEAIIEYRNVTPFTKPEDIMNVNGIGEALFEKIKAYITV